MGAVALRTTEPDRLTAIKIARQGDEVCHIRSTAQTSQGCGRLKRAALAALSAPCTLRFFAVPTFASLFLLPFARFLLVFSSACAPCREPRPNC
jgi:hypothetical protein